MLDILNYMNLDFTASLGNKQYQGEVNAIHTQGFKMDNDRFFFNGYPPFLYSIFCCSHEEAGK